MSHYKIVNLALATILSSTIPLFSATKIAIAQSNNNIFTEVNSPSRISQRQLGDHVINSNPEINLRRKQCIEFVSFLAGRELKPNEKSSILNHSVKLIEYMNNEQHVSFLQTIGKVMENVNQAKQNLPVQTRMREEIFSKLYFSMYEFRKKLRYQNSSLLNSNNVFIHDILKIVERYNPVIAADPKSQLLVTKRDLDAATSQLNFLASKAGNPPNRRHAMNEARISQNFSSLSPSKQKTLADAETNYQILISRWSRLSPQSQQEILNNVFANQNTVRQQQPATRNQSSQSRPQVSPENQRSPEESLRRAEQFNRLNQQQLTIEPVYNPAFDVPSF